MMMNIVDAIMSVGILVVLLLICVWVIKDMLKVRDARRQAQEELERYRNAFVRKGSAMKHSE